MLRHRFNLLRHLLHRPGSRVDERGASAVEYSLVLVGIAAVLVLAIVVLGGHVSDLFEGAGDCIEAQGC